VVFSRQTSVELVGVVFELELIAPVVKG
jgi:hypothetical protein